MPSHPFPPRFGAFIVGLDPLPGRTYGRMTRVTRNFRRAVRFARAHRAEGARVYGMRYARPFGPWDFPTFAHCATFTWTP